MSSSAQYSITGKRAGQSWLYLYLERASTTSVRTEEDEKGAGAVPREEEEKDVAGITSG